MPQFNAVQLSRSVMSNSLWPHGLQHTRPPCPSPTPRVYSNLYPLSRWCHQTISSSAVPFFSRLQSFPASGSFQMSQLLVSGGQSFSFNISPSNEHPGLIFLLLLCLGNQSWIFIGRTDAEAETPILWPPDEKSWLTGKDPDARKDLGQEQEATEDEMVR